MKMQSVEDLLLTGLSYVLDFEEKLTKQAGKMAEASSNAELKEAFQKSVSKGQEYGQKVEQTFGKLGKSVERNDNALAARASRSKWRRTRYVSLSVAIQTR